VSWPRHQEAITLAFVDPALQERLFPGRPALPFESDCQRPVRHARVAVAGLLRAALENQRRQADRIRLFEHGAASKPAAAARASSDTLSPGWRAAHACPSSGRAKDMRGAADFYDVKSDLAALFAGTGEPQSFTFEADRSRRCTPAVQRAAAVPVRRWVARELHPRWCSAGFYLSADPFELDMKAALVVSDHLEDFPLSQVRRDLASSWMSRYFKYPAEPCNLGGLKPPA